MGQPDTLHASPPTLLLVDDDDVDREAVRRGFACAGIHHQIIEARNGVEALALLRGSDGHEPLTRPLLILLDLNMPRMDGLELLARLRADARLADSVVFVLTTSNSEEDRQRAHALHVAGYMTKSAVGTRFERLAEMLGRYWELNELPE